MTSTDSILQHTSFNTLDKDGKKAVCGLFAKYHQDKDQVQDQDQDQTLDLPMVDLFRNRLSLAETGNDYKSRIQAINPASFKFLNPDEKLALKEELLFAFYIFSAQFDLDHTEGRRQNLKELSELIWQCAELKNSLDGKGDERQQQLDAQISAYGRHLKYLGLTQFANILQQTDNTLSDDEKRQKIDAQLEGEFFSGADTVSNQMAAVNERRLYWVWGDGFLTSVMSMLPEQFPHLAETGKTLDCVRNVFGYMSWILYYSRLGLNLALVIRHTLKGQWMSDKERSADISTYERLKFQLNQRKFALLNDGIWATVNLVTFFWLTGNNLLGYSGDVLTLGLLLVDTALTIWQCYEQYMRHKQTMDRFDGDIEKLEEQIKAEQAHSDKFEALLIEKEKLEASREKALLEWRYAQYKMAADLTYSLSLIAGFAIMCCLLPPGVLPVTALMLGVAGATASFALTIAYTTINGVIDIAQTLHFRQLNQENRNQLFKAFKKCTDDNTQKSLYLEIMRLDGETAYQSRQAAYQSAQMIRGLMIDCMIPLLVFASLTFMPTGIGIAVIAAGIAVAALSKVLINQFEPKAAQLPQFDEDEFKQFKAQPEKTSTIGFFARKGSDKSQVVNNKPANDQSTCRDNGDETDPSSSSWTTSHSLTSLTSCGSTK